ncbi:hypothetical protein DEO72_LG5g1817 [Vigna unguiculata]|uniref:Uncharacterized protein n=1 Tax=Vigna unguiculata TaxID=3917 RepID=A0A4D6LYV4_VIGUN|nr:hypothetical protein DEO72_LG5g1816 [Vigna unguiculata]QCD93741.1 hypothetical protein DEO72_LG5g1817 [Vigna unguiculata]
MTLHGSRRRFRPPRGTAHHHHHASPSPPHLQPCSQQHHLRTTPVSEPRTRTNLQQRRRNTKQQCNHWIYNIPHPWSTAITHAPQIYNSSTFRAAATTASSTIYAASSLLEKRSNDAGETKQPSFHLAPVAATRIGATNPNSGERLCVPRVRLLLDNQTCQLVHWSKSAVNSGENCKNG